MTVKFGQTQPIDLIVSSFSYTPTSPLSVSAKAGDIKTCVLLCWGCWGGFVVAYVLLRGEDADRLGSNQMMSSSAGSPLSADSRRSPGVLRCPNASSASSGVANEVCKQIHSSTLGERLLHGKLTLRGCCPIILTNNE